MAEIEGDDGLTGHSYYSKEMMKFKMSYSYRNYLEPVLLEAKDMAARNAKHVAAKSWILTAIVSTISFILYRLYYRVLYWVV